MPKLLFQLNVNAALGLLVIALLSLLLTVCSAVLSPSLYHV